MILKEHKKHADIARPSLGMFGRNEFAIVGTNCTNIQLLSKQIIASLSAQYKCAYIDASHADAEILSPQTGSGAYLEYTDKINRQQIQLSGKLNSFQWRKIFSGADLILVNGNHHAAAKQIVVIDTAKEASLKKRLQQLTGVQLFLLHENATGVFDCIKETGLPWKEIPVYKLSETEKIISFIQNKMQEAKPLLNGLVLAGGKSERMGTDKSVFNWHGKEQRIFMAEMLSSLCNDVFISCREEQQHEIENYKTIADTFTGLGPYGAILSAFRQNPDAAWLVTACDLPLLDAGTLDYLISNRDVSKIATTYESPHDGLPEPLITIWEPKAYPVLLSFLSLGYSCPRKALRNNEVKIIKAQQPEKLVNVNTPEEMDDANKILQQQTTTV